MCPLVKLVIIGLANGLVPIRRQAIIQPILTNCQLETLEKKSVNFEPIDW